MTTSQPLIVYFKPRPPHLQYGTDWIPAGLEYGPFHPGHGPFPDDATDKYDIACSSVVVQLWSHFHHKILPLLILPEADYGARRALYASLLLRKEHQHRVVKRFMWCVVTCLRNRYCTLSLPAHDMDDLDELYGRIPGLELPSLTAPNIELKILVCMHMELHKYFVGFEFHEKALEQSCSLWDKLCARGTFVALSLTAVPTPSSHGQDESEANKLGGSFRGYSPDSYLELGSPTADCVPEMQMGLDACNSIRQRKEVPRLVTTTPDTRLFDNTDGGLSVMILVLVALVLSSTRRGACEGSVDYDD
ncbi:hypothetical protein DFH06DRAFT_1349202 [Mycena polygramma]|nr:hypothetical protein DFH06DRAFT_1349202 [Mycena polygramma]